MIAVHLILPVLRMFLKVLGNSTQILWVRTNFTLLLVTKMMSPLCFYLLKAFCVYPEMCNILYLIPFL